MPPSFLKTILKQGLVMESVKTISLTALKDSDRYILEEAIHKLGFTASDYRVVEYGSYESEMKIFSPFLHRFLKVIRKSTYTKSKNAK